MSSQPQAQVDFRCRGNDCDGTVVFDLKSFPRSGADAVCPKCKRKHHLDDSAADRIGRMTDLIKAIRNAEDILADSYISVCVASGSVKVPYALLLTRINTNLKLSVDGEETDCRLWADSLN